MHPPQYPPHANGPHHVNGYHPTVDPIARALGGLETGQLIILQRLDRQDHTLADIQTQLVDGRLVHRDLMGRIVAIEKRPLAPWSAADFKLTLTAIGVVILVLLGKAEMALQLLGIGGK